LFMRLPLHLLAAIDRSVATEPTIRLERIAIDAVASARQVWARSDPEVRLRLCELNP
jgi:hypothetical protein